MLLNRSFARRIGKSLTATQNQLINNYLPQYQVSDQNIISDKNSNRRIILEIGAGSGIHFINLAKTQPENLFIGAEVYINGIASILQLTREEKLDNILLWPDDVDLLFSLIPQNYLAEIYILFPDPWPKAKHRKRRIINDSRIKTFANLLQSNGKLIFATDIEDYFTCAKNLFAKSDQFILQDDLFMQPHDNYITTKYHQAAIREGRQANFLRVIKS